MSVAGVIGLVVVGATVAYATAGKTQQATMGVLAMALLFVTDFVIRLAAG